MSGGRANMLGMTKQLPGGRRSVLELVEERGRPVRMRELLVVLGRGEAEWQGMPRRVQEEYLRPFVGEGEQLRMTNAGEVFIYDPAVLSPPSGVGSDSSLEELRAGAAGRRAFDKVLQQRTREAFTEGYIASTAELAPLVVELEERFLRDALRDGASDKDKDRALRAMKELKDRWMGRTTQSVEVTSESRSVVQQLASGGAFEEVVSSEDWTVEQVVADRRVELEGGDLGDAADALVLGDGGEE